MTYARTLLALLIALSVALLPVAGIAGFTLKSQDATEMSAAMPMEDCCPHPCDKSMADCASMAACAFNCLSYVPQHSALLVYPVLLAALLPNLHSAALPSTMGIPPFDLLASDLAQ